MNDKIKKSLYNAVAKYQHEFVELNAASRKEIKNIVSVAKSLGFIIENRSKYGLNELILFYDGKWVVNFYNQEGDNHIHAHLDEYALLTGQALKDYIAHESAIAQAEIEADRRMSAFNSGYRDF